MNIYLISLSLRSLSMPFIAVLKFFKFTKFLPFLSNYLNNFNVFFLFFLYFTAICCSTSSVFGSYGSCCYYFCGITVESVFFITGFGYYFGFYFYLFGFGVASSANFLFGNGAGGVSFLAYFLLSFSFLSSTNDSFFLMPPVLFKLYFLSSD